LAELARPGEPAFDAMSAQLQQRGMGLNEISMLLDRLVNQQAYTLSALDIFYASGILFLVMIGLIWICRPASHKRTAGPDASAGAH